jgi:transcriptional regulator with XRE-family HTH domain
MNSNPRTEPMALALARARRVMGVGQRELSEASGIPIGTLRNWEQGRRMPRLDTAAPVAKALGVSLDVLAGLVEDADEVPKRRGKK